jgi:hypothetical protein
MKENASLPGQEVIRHISISRVHQHPQPVPTEFRRVANTQHARAICDVGRQRCATDGVPTVALAAVLGRCVAVSLCLAGRDAELVRHGIAGDCVCSKPTAGDYVRVAAF